MPTRFTSSKSSRRTAGRRMARSAKTGPQYDPSEAKFKGATSAWMMAILLGPMFHYWTLTGDSRIPEMVLKWCDFLDRQGLQPDGRSAYYVINCFAGEPGELPSTVNGDMTRHDTEMSYEFAMGIYFSQDPARRAVYQKRFETLYSIALSKDFNETGAGFQLGIPSLQPAGLFHATSRRKAVDDAHQKRTSSSRPARPRSAGRLRAPPTDGPSVRYRDYSRCLPDYLRALAERAYRRAQRRDREADHSGGHPRAAAVGHRARSGNWWAACRSARR